MSKVCQQCGTEVADGYLFCPKCGARADGKKLCPTCGKPVAEEAQFCPFCGLRLDGKKVCVGCGKVLEPDVVFCPQCGTPAQPVAVAPAMPAFAQPVVAAPVAPQPGAPAPVAPTAVQPAGYAPAAPAAYAPYGAQPVPAGYPAPVYAVRRRTPAEKKALMSRIFQIVSTSLGMAAILVFFICSFVSLYSVAFDGMSQSQNAFYFLIDVFKKLPESSLTFQEGQLLMFILGAIAVGVNILATLVCLILVLVKGIPCLISGKSCKVVRYLAPCFASWAIMATTLSASYTKLSVSYQDVKLRIGLGAGPIASLILGCLFTAVIFALYVVENYQKFDVQRIKKICGEGALLIFSIVVLGCLSGNILTSHVAVGSSQPVGIPVLIAVANILNAEILPGEIAATAYLADIVFFLTVCAGVVLLWHSLYAMFDEKRRTSLLVEATVMEVLAVVYLAAVIALHVLCDNGKNIDTIFMDMAELDVAGAVICVMVFASLALAVAITFFVLTAPKKTMAPIPMCGAYPGAPVAPGTAAPVAPATPGMPGMTAPTAGMPVEGQTVPHSPAAGQVVPPTARAETPIAAPTEPAPSAPVAEEKFAEPAPAAPESPEHVAAEATTTDLSAADETERK